MQKGGGEERQSLESKRVNRGKCLHYFLEETFVAGNKWGMDLCFPT